MGEIDHATLEARIARVSWARLRGVSLALDGCAGADEAVERVTARGLVPLEWFTAEQRSYWAPAKKRTSPRPARVGDVALVAAAHATITQSEALALEAYARLRDHGFAVYNPAIWYLEPGRFTASDGTSMVRAGTALAAYALDELSAYSFDAEAFSAAFTRGGPIDRRLSVSCTHAAASILTLRTAWKTLHPSGEPSPASPIAELFALGTVFVLGDPDLALTLPEPEHPLLACPSCKRVEPYEPASHRGEYRMACPACGVFCPSCFAPPVARACVACGADASARRAGPAG